MKVRLQWFVQNQNSDHGLLSEDTWRAISRVASIFGVKPEDVAAAWLDGVLQQHRVYVMCGGVASRLETVKFSASIWAALDRLRAVESPEASLSQFLEQIFHERFFATDPLYASDWMAEERARFEADCMARERRRLLALKEARGR